MNEIGWYIVSVSLTILKVFIINEYYYYSGYH